LAVSIAASRRRTYYRVALPRPAFRSQVRGSMFSFFRKYGRREERDGEAESAVRQGEDKPVGTAERVSAAGRRQGVLRVVRRVQVDVVVQSRRRAGGPEAEHNPSR